MKSVNFNDLDIKDKEKLELFKTFHKNHKNQRTIQEIYLNLAYFKEENQEKQEKSVPKQRKVTEERKMIPSFLMQKHIKLN